MVNGHKLISIYVRRNVKIFGSYPNVWIDHKFNPFRKSIQIQTNISYNSLFLLGTYFVGENKFMIYQYYMIF